MKKKSGVAAAFLAAALVAANSAQAEVSQECIFSGTINRSESTDNAVRVNFSRAEHGDQAPCRIKNRRSKWARIQFKADPEDGLGAIPDGTLIKYRYQRIGNENHWKLLSTSTRRIASND